MFYFRLNLKGSSNINTTRSNPSRNRGRIIRTTSGRGRGGSVIMGSRPVVPAPYVPEELISQVSNSLYLTLFLLYYILAGLPGIILNTQLC